MGSEMCIRDRTSSEPALAGFMIGIQPRRVSDSSSSESSISTSSFDLPEILERLSGRGSAVSSISDNKLLMGIHLIPFNSLGKGAKQFRFSFALTKE